MPLVAHNELPTYGRLRKEGYRVLSPERADSQDIRALHVGLLNMMPDAALEATERQFFRLVGSSNPITQFHVHPFTLDEIPRSPAAREHIARHYEPFERIDALGLDALIVSGANVTQPDLSAEIFWEPLKRVIDWADEHVTSTLCSCLATHAVMLARHGVRRRRLAEKCWGVFEHEVTRRDHPLVADVNTRMAVPQSRFNAIDRAAFEGAGLHVLVESEESRRAARGQPGRVPHRVHAGAPRVRRDQPDEGVQARHRALDRRASRSLPAVPAPLLRRARAGGTDRVPRSGDALRATRAPHRRRSPKRSSGRGSTTPGTTAGRR